MVHMKKINYLIFIYFDQCNHYRLKTSYFSFTFARFFSFTEVWISCRPMTLTAIVVSLFTTWFSCTLSKVILIIFILVTSNKYCGAIVLIVIVWIEGLHKFLCIYIYGSSQNSVLTMATIVISSSRWQDKVYLKINI